MRSEDGSIYIVSNSEAQAFKKCKRKWYLTYHRKLEPIITRAHGARDTGTLVHETLRRYYRNNQDETGAISWLDAQRHLDVDAAVVSDIPMIHASFDLARSIVEGYYDWLSATGADARLIVEAVETSITIPSDVPGVVLTGKLDLQVFDAGKNKRFVLDHKSVAGFSEAQKILHLNEQGPLYSWLQRKGLPDAPPLHGVLWNMLKKTKRGPKSKPPYYARTEILMTETSLDRFWVQMRGQILDMLAVEDALNNGADHNLVAYPTPSQDCTWSCPMYSVCGLMNDPAYDSEYVIAANFSIGNPLKRYDNDMIEGEITV